MPSSSSSAVYEIRRTFRVPLAFAFRWCTDYTTHDGKLSEGGQLRRVLERTRRRVVFEDLSENPDGWFWSRYEVSLHPPDRWTATASGNYRTWELTYTLRPLAQDLTEFKLRGRRRPAGLGRKNPSQRAMKAELQEMWRNYARAMEADYRAEGRRSAR